MRYNEKINDNITRVCRSLNNKYNVDLNSNELCSDEINEVLGIFKESAKLHLSIYSTNHIEITNKVIDATNIEELSIKIARQTNTLLVLEPPEFPENLTINTRPQKMDHLEFKSNELKSIEICICLPKILPFKISLSSIIQLQSAEISLDPWSVNEFIENLIHLMHPENSKITIYNLIFLPPAVFKSNNKNLQIQIHQHGRQYNNKEYLLDDNSRLCRGNLLSIYTSIIAEYNITTCNLRYQTLIELLKSTTNVIYNNIGPDTIFKTERLKQAIDKFNKKKKNKSFYNIIFIVNN